jgi:hypothetical protein
MEDAMTRDDLNDIARALLVARDDSDAWKARAERAEMDLTKERDAAVEYEAELRKRAEQAERARDEARTQFDNLKECYDSEVRDCERVEADNAYLLWRLSDTTALIEAGRVADAIAELAEARRHDRHRGAALLERLRALEETMGDISTACETKDLRTSSAGAHAVEQQRKVIEQVWRLARAALEKNP